MASQKRSTSRHVVETHWTPPSKCRRARAQRSWTCSRKYSQQCSFRKHFLLHPFCQAPRVRSACISTSTEGAVGVGDDEACNAFLAPRGPHRIPAGQRHVFFKFPCTLLDLCGMTVQVPASAGDKTISGVVSMLQEMLDKSKEDGENDRKVYPPSKSLSAL